jgi:hypothetical protein
MLLVIVYYRVVGGVCAVKVNDRRIGVADFYEGM